MNEYVIFIVPVKRAPQSQNFLCGALYITVVCSDCNPGIEFAIPGSGIERFVIPRSHFGIRLTD